MSSLIPQHPEMSSAFPYFLKARVHFINMLYAWISDNGMTPHILVDTTMEGVQIPKGIDKDGKVVLNIAMRSANQLSISEDLISFGGSFGGRHASIRIPMRAVLAIYCKETGVGMGFPEEPAFENHVKDSMSAGVVEDVPVEKPVLAAVTTPPSDDNKVTPITAGKRDRSHLSVVK